MPGSGLLADAVGGVLDGFMRSIWTGTLTLLRAVLGLVGELGSLDVTPGGGAISQELWRSMLSLAAIIAMILFFAQLAMAALNPRRHLLQAATGPVQYGIALVLAVTMVAALLGAADGMTSVILQSGAGVTDIGASMDGLGLVDDNNAVKAVVLGLLGIVAIVPLAIGYGVTLLFRSASILVLVATLPITAAGLINLVTKHWFWRAIRWLLALIFLKPAFALCFALGTGVVSAAGRTAGPTATDPGAPVAPAAGTGVVTLLLGLGIMFVALFAPYALFRLLAFIEPGTQPHQAMMGAFGAAMSGFRQAGAGIAGADVGSAISAATSGRFGGTADGTGPGSGSSDQKQQDALAAAVAGGGATAAAGTSGAAASAGIAGAGSAGPPAAGDASDEQSSVGETDGATVSEGAQPTGGTAAGTGRDGGPFSGGFGIAGGAGTRGSVNGSAPSGSLAGLFQAAQVSAGAVGGGGVAAAGAALGSVGSGARSAAQGISGRTPMPPSPQGGTAGRVGGDAPSDYGGAPSAPSGLPPSRPYRDPSFDMGHTGFDDHTPPTRDGDDTGDDPSGLSGVIR